MHSFSFHNKSNNKTDFSYHHQTLAQSLNMDELTQAQKELRDDLNLLKKQMAQMIEMMETMKAMIRAKAVEAITLENFVQGAMSYPPDVGVAQANVQKINAQGQVLSATAYHPHSHTIQPNPPYGLPHDCTPPITNNHPNTNTSIPIITTSNTIQIPNSPVCRAISYSDLAPALLAYGASAVVIDASGEKTISVRELIDAHTADSLPALIVREFIVPVCRGWSGFTKYALRHSIDFPIINFALCMGDSIRLFAGAIAPNVVELSETAEYLSAHPDFDIEEVSALAVAEMQLKCALIREAGLSVPVKRSAFAMVREILEAYRSANA